MDTRLVNLLGAMATAVHDGLASEVTAGSGLTLTEASALNRVGQAPGCSISDVRVGLGITHPGTVRVVDALVRRGLVVRGAGRDGRSVSLHLTESGRDVWEAVVRRRLAVLEAALGAVRLEDRPCLERAICAVLTALTGDEASAEHICRLCEERDCPQDACPVTLAAGGAS